MTVLTPALTPRLGCLGSPPDPVGRFGHAEGPSGLHRWRSLGLGLAEGEGEQLMNVGALASALLRAAGVLAYSAMAHKQALSLGAGSPSAAAHAANSLGSVLAGGRLQRGQHSGCGLSPLEHGSFTGPCRSSPGCGDVRREPRRESSSDAVQHSENDRSCLCFCDAPPVL